MGRIADRTVGALESGLAGIENRRPNYANHYQRQGGEAIAGLVNPKSTRVNSYEGAVGRKAAETLETGVKVYSKTAPIYKSIKSGRP